VGGGAAPGTGGGGGGGWGGEFGARVARTVPNYSVGGAWEAYRGNIVSGLWLTVIAASAIEQSDHNANLICALVERNCAAIRDWDALNAF